MVQSPAPTVLRIFTGGGTALIILSLVAAIIPSSPLEIIAISIPFLIGISGITSFIQALAITGSVAGGIEGILIILMFWKAKKLGDRKPEYTINLPKTLAVFFMIMFALGILYQFF